MIYPAYRVIDAEGNFRSFFWFCFARLQALDESSSRYSDYLGSEYTTKGRQPYWDWQGNGDQMDATQVVRIEAAFHTNEWDGHELATIFDMPLFKDLKWSLERGEFVVVGIDTTGKFCTEVMYPLMMARNILSSRECCDEFMSRGMDFQSAALLSSQFTVVKDFRGQRDIQEVGEDYELAETFEGLAKLQYEVPKYEGVAWGRYDNGYNGHNDDFCDLPESSFELPKDAVELSDITDMIAEAKSEGRQVDGFGEVMKYFKDAMEKH